MQVLANNVQTIREGDWILVNDGDDRHFTAAEVVSRVVIKSSTSLKSYSLQMRFPKGTRYTSTYYHNEKVNRINSF